MYNGNLCQGFFVTLFFLLFAVLLANCCQHILKEKDVIKVYILFQFDMDNVKVSVLNEFSINEMYSERYSLKKASRQARRARRNENRIYT